MRTQRIFTVAALLFIVAASTSRAATVWRKFVLPKSVTILGKEQPPLCMTVKVTIYKGAPNAIKGYFTNFRLYKVKGP